MTVFQLHKLLSKVIAEGGARLPVAINKDTFTHPLESDGIVIIEVRDVKTSLIPQADGDGAIIINVDGTERHKATLVLLGEREAPSRENAASLNTPNNGAPNDQ